MLSHERFANTGVEKTVQSSNLLDKVKSVASNIARSVQNRVMGAPLILGVAGGAVASCDTSDRPIDYASDGMADVIGDANNGNELLPANVFFIFNKKNYTIQVFGVINEPNVSIELLCLGTDGQEIKRILWLADQGNINTTIELPKDARTVVPFINGKQGANPIDLDVEFNMPAGM